MLDGSSSRLAHALQNTSLILLSFLFLPLDTTILFFSLVAKYTLQLLPGRNGTRTNSSHIRRTVLVTGVGMTKGLVLARLFHQAGHRVVGADFEPSGSLSPGRLSNALDVFYRLHKPNSSQGSAPYLQSLLNIVLKERVDLWVSCSGVASAVEDGEAKEVLEARTDCKAIQFDVATTQVLHEKHTFMEHTREIGLNIPDTHTVSSQADAYAALQQAPSGRQYIMKPIGMDDSARGDMTLLPKKSDSETKKHLEHLNISKKSQWILQQFIKGKEYCTHSLVINGKVKAFVACPSSELLMYYEALPMNSALSKAMLSFTEQYATKAGKGFTGHLSFDFLVEDESPVDWDEIVLYPIECNPRAHTAVALFNDTPQLVDAYMSLLSEDNAPASREPLITPIQPKQYFWIGHDLVELLIMPSLKIITGKTSPTVFVKDMIAFWNHVLLWRDGTYDLQDPLPWWCLYHIYWPSQLLSCLITGKKWSRVNVSTLKMFEC